MQTRKKTKQIVVDFCVLTVCRARKCSQETKIIILKNMSVIDNARALHAKLEKAVEAKRERESQRAVLERQIASERVRRR